LRQESGALPRYAGRETDLRGMLRRAWSHDRTDQILRELMATTVGRNTRPNARTAIRAAGRQVGR
jgi:hypothetical protein